MLFYFIIFCCVVCRSLIYLFHIVSFPSPCRLGCFKQGGDGSSSSTKIPHAASTESSSSSRHASHSPATSTGHGGRSKKSVVNLSYTTGHPAPAFPPDTPDKCSMCWFQFSLFKRAHHCRLCGSLCCDECSKKRCLLEYSQVSVLLCCAGLPVLWWAYSFAC